MHGNELIFSRSGSRQKLYRVSTLLFPQYTILNAYFLPDEHELPAHGLTTEMIAFDFGFSDPTLVIAPYDTVPFPYTLGMNFLAESITGVSDVLGVATPPVAGSLINTQVDPPFLINFQHTHQGNTRQWMQKAVSSGEAVGRGENPLLFKSPVLLPKGDTITCTLTNLTNGQLRAQILLLGGAFD